MLRSVDDPVMIPGLMADLALRVFASLHIRTDKLTVCSSDETPELAVHDDHGVAA